MVVLCDVEVGGAVDEVGIGAKESRGRTHGAYMVVMVVVRLVLVVVLVGWILIIVVAVGTFSMTHPAVPEGPVEEAGGYGLDEYDIVPPH